MTSRAPPGIKQYDGSNASHLQPLLKRGYHGLEQQGEDACYGQGPNDGGEGSEEFADAVEDPECEAEQEDDGQAGEGGSDDFLLVGCEEGRRLDGIAHGQRFLPVSIERFLMLQAEDVRRQWRQFKFLSLS